MKLKDVYEMCVTEGIKTDPRTKGQISKQLSGYKREYQKLSASEKKYYDLARLKNPYADTRVLHGHPNLEVRRILVGIDIEPGELMMADHLAQRGDEVDLVMAHHPEGIALSGLYEVMHQQTDMLINLGIGEKAAGGLMKRRIEEVKRRLHSANHNRSVDAAKLLDIPFMCCHTPADNHVATYLQKLVNSKKPKTLKHIVDLLMKEPEYRAATHLKAGPDILIGKSSDKAGKVVLDMTGGTEGSKDIFGRLSQLGVNTMLGMHYSEAHFGKMKSEFMNVVNAGHMASDNLGMNLLLDKIERKGKVEILCCSGFERFRRY